MIITRTPLRISIGGGGTDLPSSTELEGRRVVISAAITKYVYIGINRTFVNDYFIKYSALERVRRLDDIEHPLDPRGAAARAAWSRGSRSSALADIPAGTGLGSSGTFTVGLLRALYAFKREHVSAGDLAEEACQIEIDLLGQPVGKQDQYIAAFGGLTVFEFHADELGRRRIRSVSRDTLHDLEAHLLLFFTGSPGRRLVLSDQRTRSRGRRQGDDRVAHVRAIAGPRSRPRSSPGILRASGS